MSRFEGKTWRGWRWYFLPWKLLPSSLLWLFSVCSLFCSFFLSVSLLNFVFRRGIISGHRFLGLLLVWDDKVAALLLDACTGQWMGALHTYTCSLIHESDILQCSVRYWQDWKAGIEFEGKLHNTSQIWIKLQSYTIFLKYFNLVHLLLLFFNFIQPSLPDSSSVNCWSKSDMWIKKLKFYYV